MDEHREIKFFSIGKLTLIDLAGVFSCGRSRWWHDGACGGDHPADRLRSIRNAEAG